MTEEERNVLQRMLTDLISAQDNVTHANESGPGYEQLTRMYIQDRDAIQSQILDYVDSLCNG